MYSGASLGELNLLETVETESNIGSWYSVSIKDESYTHFRIELRGIENNIRIRQIKLLGYSNDVKGFLDLPLKKHTSAHHIQQKYCELETLRVFRVLTNQVFGKLIISQERPMMNQNYIPSLGESHMDSSGGDSLDLREHMVGILFSRSKLTHLQKQVRCVITFTKLDNDLCLLISLDYCSYRAFHPARSTKVPRRMGTTDEHHQLNQLHQEHDELERNCSAKAKRRLLFRNAEHGLGAIWQFRRQNVSLASGRTHQRFVDSTPHRE